MEINKVNNIGEVLNKSGSLSKKAAKKVERQLSKETKREEANDSGLVIPPWQSIVAEDFCLSDYGMVPLRGFLATREFVDIRYLIPEIKGEFLWLRARIAESRCKGSLGFFLLRQSFFSVQGVANVNQGTKKDLLKWLKSLPIESIVDIYGKVVVPEIPVSSSSQRVEIIIHKAFCVSAASKELPFQLKDANRPEVDSHFSDGNQIRVLQDVRLDNRILDLRTFANQAIFRIQAMVCELFREFLIQNRFIEIHTPKILGGASEGGASVFTLKYFGQPACLAQSPQLYKQMAICGDMDRVFEIGPVFRAENSNTHRHLCEFIGLDIEMTIKNSYIEVVDLLEELFIFIFNGINTRCQYELEVMSNNYSYSPFQIPVNTPRLTFEEGCNLLRESGVEIPNNIKEFDLSTEHEKLLGSIVKEKYNSDFYILLRYPLKVRPFYTMPDPADPENWSNSYDFFMRGEEIISGAQRIHDYDFLMKRAEECGLVIESIKEYIDSFKLGAFPHGGCGIGLERVVMLFLNLGNIRRSSMFPRDPKRLNP
ncbi:aspartyl-tRNA synthetase family protein [Cryptosporidium andersoni]|uniref:aspartate--tRNA ligase n=1 Tax=Cryptosporidium andersoni TaxID=117008 RepID=A0A1J4MS47_9CRYT|nr:aspartyl-tRNA synthetase family protein [Cryptosporidium andersoni]